MIISQLLERELVPCWNGCWWSSTWVLL